MENCGDLVSFFFGNEILTYLTIHLVSVCDNSNFQVGVPLLTQFPQTIFDHLFPLFSHFFVYVSHSSNYRHTQIGRDL